MESTLDPSSISGRQRNRVVADARDIPNDGVCYERTCSTILNDCKERKGTCCSADIGCSHFCRIGSTSDNCFSHSGIVFHPRRTEAYSSLELGNGSRKHEQCKNDTESGSKLSPDAVQLSTCRHRNGPVKSNVTFSYPSSEQASTSSSAQYDHSEFIKHKKPPVVCTHIRHKRTLFYSFSNFLCLTFLLASLITPSLSSTTSLAPSSQNPKSWSFVALQIVDAGTESNKIVSHRIPIPDTTAIVGRLFQFQIPQSAFSGDVSKFKAIQAGSNGLPQWIHLDDTTGLFTGVPLPKDKGQIYISVDGHVTLGSGKVSLESAIFSLNVLQPNMSDNSSAGYHLKYPNLIVDCDQSFLTRPVESCLPHESPVLANVLFLVSFNSLTPLERKELFVTTAILFDVCLEHLELRYVNWTKEEGVWLWSKLAFSEITDTLESSTILSFQVGCGSFNYFTQAPLLELMHRSTDICRDGLLLNDERYLWVTCHQWFITAGTKTFISEFDVKADNQGLVKNDRFVRQAGDDGTDGGIGILPPGFGDDDDGEISSSPAMTSPSSSQIEASTTIMATSSISVPSSLVPTSSAILSSSPFQSSIASTQTRIASMSSFQTSSIGGISSIQSSLPASSSVSTSQLSGQDTTSSSSFSRLSMVADVTTSLRQPADHSTVSSVIALTTVPLSSSVLNHSRSLSNLQLIPVSTTGVVASSFVESIQPSSSLSELISSVPTRPTVATESEEQTAAFATPQPTSALNLGDQFSITSASSEIVTRSLFSSVPFRSLSTMLPEASPQPSFMSIFSSKPLRPLSTMLPEFTPQPSSTVASSSSLPPFSSQTVSSSMKAQVGSSSPLSSSLADTEELPGETTAVMMIITPSATTPRVSFMIPSTIEDLSPTTVLASSPSMEDSSFLFSITTSDILEPFSFTSSPVMDFTITTATPTPIRTTHILMPLPTSELSLSMSVFSPSSVVEDTSSVFLPSSTSRVMTTESPMAVTTSMEIFTFQSSFFSAEISSTFGFVTPSPSQSDVRLMPMSSSELTLSISLFTLSPLPSSTMVTTSQVASFSIPPSSTFIMSSSPLPTPLPSLTGSIEASSISSFFFLVDTTSESSTLPTTPSFSLSASSSIPPLTTTTQSVLTSDILFSLMPSSSFDLTLPPTPDPSPPFMICDVVDCNNGMCIPDPDVLYVCLCFPGWTGMFCDVPITTSPLSTIPTMSFSPAQPSLMTFLISSSMDILLPFSSSVLTEGLTPIQTSIVISPTPETSVVVFPTPSPTIILCDCVNGDCVTDDEGGYICVCFIGFTGESCETSISIPTPDLSSTSLIADLTTSSVFFFVSSSENLLVPFSSTPLSTSSVLTPSPSTSDLSLSSTLTLTFFMSSSESLLVPFSSPSPSSFTSSVVTPSPVTSDLEFSSTSVLDFVLSSSESVLVPFSPTPSISSVSSVIPLPSVSSEFSVGSRSSLLFFVSSSESLLVPFSSSSTRPSSSLVLSPTPQTSELSISSTPSFSFLISSSESLLVPLSPTPMSTTISSFLFFFSSSESLLLPLSSPSPLPTVSPSTSITSSISTSISQFATVLVSPTPTLSLTDCDFIVCTNGDCIADSNGDFIRCDCYPGWSGMFCDERLPSTSLVLTLSPTPSPPFNICDFIDCNNGTCMPLNLGENFTCICPPGFTGEFCETQLTSTVSLMAPSSDVTITPSSTMVSFVPSPSPPPPPICDDAICNNNGNCIQTVFEDTKFFECVCFPGWTGKTCDIPIPLSSPTQATSSSSLLFFVSSSENIIFPFSTSILAPLPSISPTPSPSPMPPICENVNCSGNGECVDMGEDFNCSCYPGWTGDICETDIDYCLPSGLGNCNETGTAMCIDGNSTHTCMCFGGFTGELCSIDIDDCDPNPCFNNSTCVDLPFGVFLCVCPSGFTGVLCNETISSCDPNPCMDPEETCVVIGPEEDDYMCIIFPITTITDDTTSTIVPSPTIDVTTSSLSTSSVIISSPVSISSSILLSSSPIPIPTPPPPNVPPIVLNSVGTLLANEGQVTHFMIPEMTFYDPDSGSTTSNLRLSLLDFSGNNLPNTTWIQLSNRAIQALPLNEQTGMRLVTEYTFILRASDEQGASTHDFVTVRVLRQQENFLNFLVVLFQGNFMTFSQNLTGKIFLAQGLSAHVSDSNLNSVSSTPNIYIKTFRNGSIAVVYRDLSIPDNHCEDFREWVLSIYSDSAFTFDFLQRLPSEFVPISAPVIEGPCNISDTNPTVALTPRIQPDPQSNLILFLATVIPTVAVACMCLLVGVLVFANYRRRREERSRLRSRAMEKTFTCRRPILLDEEWDLPNRRRRPVILPDDRVRPAQPARRGPLLEEFDLGGGHESSDEGDGSVRLAPEGSSLVVRNRYATMSPDPPAEDDAPPPYELPPLFPT